MTSDQIITQESREKAIRNKEYHGFETDYLVLDSLLRHYQPKTFLEIGTNMGRGTKIIKNALGADSTVYSLDLPTELAHVSLQHPISEGKGDSVGHLCDLPFIQLRGDSMKFDYKSLGKIEGVFIDGEHDFDHPYHETSEILNLLPNIIIWHDADIREVWMAINEAIAFNNYETTDTYTLFRVEDCRIAYAIRN